SSGRSKTRGARTRLSRSNQGSDIVERATGKNARSFENRAGNYDEDQRIELCGRKTPATRNRPSDYDQGLSAAHANFLLAIEPLIDDSIFNLVTKGEDVTAESIKATTDLVEGNVSRIDQLFTINAEGNSAAGLLTEAAHVGDSALIQPIRER